MFLCLLLLEYLKAFLRDKIAASCFIHVVILIELCNSNYPENSLRFQYNWKRRNSFAVK